MEKRKKYYLNTDILFELIHQHKHRETFFLPYHYDSDKKKFVSQKPIRWLNASAIRFMKKHWKRYKFLEKPMNLYHSLATYKDFPTFSYNYREKSQQQKIWMKEFHKYIIAYDFFVETDSKDLKKSIDIDGITIKEFFDEYNAKYYCNYSGSKGLHFIIPYDEWDFIDLDIYNEGYENKIKNFNDFVKKFPMSYAQMKKKIDLVTLFKVIAHRMKLLLACDTIDTTVQDIKRVKKTGYSYDIKSKFIAYALSDDMLYNFSTDLVTPEKVLSYNNHKRRLLYRNVGVPKKKRQKGYEKMLIDLGILKD